LKEAIIGLHAAATKVPAQRDAIFIKGLQKFGKYLVAGFNSLLLTLGTAEVDPTSLANKKQYEVYGKKLISYERLISTLAAMFND